VRLDALPLLVAGPLLQYALPLLWPHVDRHGGLEMARAIVLYGATLGFLLINRRHAGAWLVLAGACGNALATLSSGGRMPVALSALRRFPAHAVAALAAGGFGAHGPMVHPAGVGWLGDVLASPAPLPPEAMSVGDIFIGCGLAVFLAAGMRARLPEP